MYFYHVLCFCKTFIQSKFLGYVVKQGSIHCTQLLFELFPNFFLYLQPYLQEKEQNECLSCCLPFSFQILSLGKEEGILSYIWNSTYSVIQLPNRLRAFGIVEVGILRLQNTMFLGNNGMGKFILFFESLRIKTLWFVYSVLFICSDIWSKVIFLNLNFKTI